jgi:hypothetical protein
MKRILFAAALIFVSWAAVDTLVHRFVLQDFYTASPALWRPMEEMNPWLINIASTVLVAVFVVAYARLVRPKSLSAGLCYGSILGMGFGVASGLGTYIHSPIPISLALAWTALGAGKGIVAGAILGVFVDEGERGVAPAA